MNIVVIGGGGREHAIITELAKDNRIDKIYALPGNAGITQAENIPIKATDLEGVLEFIKKTPVDFVVVAPDDPLALGMVDKIEALGIPCFGPNQKAAQIEASKSFAKDLMQKNNIPTAQSRIFTDYDEAVAYIKEQGAPIVIKADGLALGKGVTVAKDLNQALNALKEAMVDKKFGNAGDKVVIEEFLTGPEVSVLSFCDGKTIVPMVSSMDHKPIGENNTGPNTGGMGTIAPNPYYTPEVAKECMEKIFLPTVKGLCEEGAPFKGCLYFGLMLTPDGPKVIEYNCRFGDPEAQVVLPLLKTPLIDVMQAVANENLDKTEVVFDNGAACCVVMASDGYPGKYETGKVLTLPETLEEDEAIYVAGSKKENNNLLTNGGRVLGAVAKAENLEEAIKKAYQLVEKIDFENAYFRRDIGQAALKAQNG